MADQVQVSYDELVQRYGQAVADNIVNMLNEGVSPTLIRELDPWTGAIHWEYAMPYPTGNVNIWQVPVNEQGQAEPDKAVWVGPAPPPGLPPTAQDLQKPTSTGGVSVQVVTQPVSVPKIPFVPPGATRPGTSAIGTSASTPTPGPVEEKKMADASLDDLIIARAGGDNYYSWDEWNWFYEQVTGQTGPAPEDRGLARNAAGDVVINGSARYNYATWKKYAFPGGFGGEPGGTSPPPAATGLLAQVEHLIRMLLAFVVGGKRV
jgi:hypothetical protein